MSALVVGLDLSINATGAATSAGELFTVKTKTADGDRRLTTIREKLRPEIGVADLVVIEDLPSHARSAGVTGMVQGVARGLCLDLGIPYVLVPAATLKKYATGNGGAAKPDMRMALYQRTGLDVKDDNQVDAWWLRAAGLDALGQPLVVLPKAQRVVLAKVKGWPHGVVVAV